MENCKKKCPFIFDNLTIQNIILILLTLKTVWNMFKENGPEINIEDILMSQMKNSNPLGNINSIFDLNSLSSPTGPLSSPMCPMPCVSNSNSFSFFNFCLLGIFIYLIFFVRDILENFGLNVCDKKVCDKKVCDKKVCDKNLCNILKCPFNFGENKV